MSTEVTVVLPDEILQQAEMLADRTGRPVRDVLSETIELSLRPLGSADEWGETNWSDSEVLAAAELEMDPDQDARLSELLDRQQAGLIDAGERSELTALMSVYQQLLLRKAQALREAVTRGSREPLAS